MITPAAARAIFEAVHWTPSIRWEIDEIRILEPIRTAWIALQPDDRPSRRSATAADLVGAGNPVANVLLDVAYIVTAHFDMTRTASADETTAQHSAMFRRRLDRSNFFRAPFLGMRSFPASITPVEKGEEPPGAAALRGTIDLGWMLYDLRYHQDQRPRFYRPTMIDGVIDLRQRDALILAG